MFEILKGIVEREKTERGIIAITRLNKMEKRIEIKKEITIRKYYIRFEWRSRKNFWGRFGGGWNWHIGIEWSRKTAIFYLLIFMIIIGKKS